MSGLSRPSDELLAQAPEPVREYIAALEARLRQEFEHVIAATVE